MVKSVILALGSNDEGDHRVKQALAILQQILDVTKVSSIMQTHPIGDLPGPFHNCLVTGYTSAPVDQLTRQLKQTERRCGDQKSLRRQGKIVMDIDLMEYDGDRYHLKDWQRPYIRQLLTEINEHQPTQPKEKDDEKP